MADIIPDPFSQVYDAVWYWLEANTKWAALVKPGNRIKLSHATNPPIIKTSGLQRSDFPLAELTLDRLEFNNVPSQAYSLMTQRFILNLVSGLTNLREMHSPLLWQTIRALSRAPQNLSKNFVTRFNVTTGETRELFDGEYGGKQGWISPVNIDVELKLLRSELDSD